MDKKANTASKMKFDEEKALDQFIKVMVKLGLKYGHELLTVDYSEAV